jgi:glycosyltransferase involved in cell wall biosynthesis
MNPFFSILIPTKNRHLLIGEAIESVLNQEFTDFEIIIVDNDDGDATYNVVSRYQDPRIQYYRTGDLSMVANWEYARKKASGKYLTVLEDKMTYYPWALKKIYALIEWKKISVVVWGISVNTDNVSAEFDIIDNSQHLPSTKVIESYINGEPLIWRKLPRIINSCVSAQLIEKIVQVNNGNFFCDNSPDLVAAFSQLALTKDIFYIEKILTSVKKGNSFSLSTRLNKSKSLSYFSGSQAIDTSKYTSNVPIKNYYIVFNCVYNDYLLTRLRLKGNLSDFEMEDEIYCRLCLEDAFITLFAGGNIVHEIKDVLHFMRQVLTVKLRWQIYRWWLKQLAQRSFALLKQVVSKKLGY